MFKESFAPKKNKPEAKDLEFKSLDSEEKKEENEEFRHIEVKEYARNYFNNILDSKFLDKMDENSDIAPWKLSEDLQQHLSALSKSENEWKKGQITKNFRTAVYIFLNELVDFVKENEDNKEIDKFVEIIYKNFFSFSPDLSSILDFKSSFNFAAKATRARKIQASIGGSILGELAYSIGWDYDPDSESDELFKSYIESSISEKLDKINLLGSLSAELISAGNAFNYGNKKIVKLLNKIKEENNNVFLKYYIEILENILEGEYENPSKSFIQYSKDPGNSRLWQELTIEEKKESDYLSSIIIPNKPLKSGEKVIKIANNMVAIADHSNLVIKYAKLNLDKEDKYQFKISGSFLVKIKDALENNKKNINLEKFIKLSNEQIFIPLDNFDNNNSEKFAAIWENFSNISKNDWKKYFDLSTIRDKFINKVQEYEIIQNKIAEENNFQETLKVYEIYKTEYPQVLNQINNPNINQAYEEFIEAYDSGDYDYAFDKLEYLKKALKFINDSLFLDFNDLKIIEKSEDDNFDVNLSNKIKFLIKKAEKLDDVHIKNFQNCQLAVDKYYNKLSSEIYLELFEFNELFDKIVNDKENILKNFETKLNLIIEEEKKNKISVNFISFDDLLKDYSSTLKDFDVNEGELLFQHLYNPAMRKKIENDFGIKLNDLPFHYHIHFLRFLSERDEQEVEKIKEFLNQGDNKEDKINKVKSFFSLEFDDSMGLKIVEIGEFFNKETSVADTLFAKYVEFVEQLNKNVDDLEDLYKDIFFDKNIDKDKLVKLMMLRANQLLSSAHEKIKSANSSEVEFEIKSLLQELDKEIDNKFKNLQELKGIAKDLNNTTSSIDKENKSKESNNQVNRIKKALEKKVDQLVYGHELAQLPKDFTNFESNQVSPEKIPEQAPLYFPVGISKDLPAWESVLSGDMKFAKPIDLYGYLFWLNNQNRKIDLIVCDEIQVNNYQLRYGKSKEESQSFTMKIGEEESKNYQKIIDSFNLSNIRIIRYKDFLNSNKEKYNHYTQIIEKLKNHPVFEKMFLSMVQESVSGAEKAEYLSYANEELAWILSTDGTKVGHLNEARYDILSALIKNLELAGHKLEIDTINNLNDDNVLSILQSIARNLRDIINEKKSKLEKKSSPFLYYQRLQEHLNKINIDKKIKPDKRIKKSEIALNFSCPDVGSASFGWRGDLDKNESAVKFKEPYSTYFYKSKGDLLTNSDQVVALEDGYISGKILTLEHSKQIDYANNVLKPMLNHYLKTLDNVPLDYFKKVAKNKEELIKELNNSQSLLDLLKYIQKYIVKPVSQ